MLNRLSPTTVLHPVLLATPFAVLSLLLAVQSTRTVEAVETDPGVATLANDSASDSSLTASITEPPRLGAAIALADEEVAVLVNGRRIPVAMIEAMMTQRPEGAERPDREMVLEEIIDMEILAQQAELDGLHQRPEIAAELMLQYTHTLANEWVAEQKRLTANDAEQLRATYEEYLATLPNDEFRASHILVDDKAKAEALVAELQDSADFLELASVNSTEPNASLGWVTSRTATPEIIEALSSLKPGEFNTVPVESDYGFHILRLDESRRAPKPDFDDIKPRIVETAVTQLVTRRLSELRESGDIERK